MSFCTFYIKNVAESCFSAAEKLSTNNQSQPCSETYLISYLVWHECRGKKSQTKYPAELVPSHRLSNNSNSHASEAIIAAECLCLINCGYALSTFVWRSCVRVSACVNQLVCVCPWAFTRSCWSCACVRVCANCKSMSLLISIRDVALLWFGGMGGRGLEVADQDRQKSPRIPSQHPLPTLSLSYVSLHHPPFTHPHHETIFIINLFIHSFVSLIIFHFVRVFHAACLILEQLGGVAGKKQWVEPEWFHYKKKTKKKKTR